jgi:hypothetical protein
MRKNEMGWPKPKGTVDGLANKNNSLKWASINWDENAKNVIDLVMVWSMEEKSNPSII